MGPKLGTNNGTPPSLHNPTCNGPSKAKSESEVASRNIYSCLHDSSGLPYIQDTDDNLGVKRVLFINIHNLHILSMYYKLLLY